MLMMTRHATGRMLRIDFFGTLPLFLALSLCTGCAHFQPAPLNLVSPNVWALNSLVRTLPSGAQIDIAPPLQPMAVAELAVLNDPDLIAARLQHKVGQADLLTAGLPPDPSITGGFAALLSGPAIMPALSASLAEDISPLITYSVNRKAAKAALAQIDAGILWQEWQVASQAEQLCITLQGDRETVATLRADHAALDRVDADIFKQVQDGNLTIAAASASQAALAANDTSLNTALQTQAQDRDQLDGLLGLASGVDLQIANVAPPAIDEQTANRAIGRLATTRPDLLALEAGYTQADAKLRAAILAQFLPINLGAAGGRDTSNVVSAGPQVTLTLPLFNRNRGGIANAEATRAVLAAQFRASLASATANARSLLTRIALLQTQTRIADGEAARAGSIAAQARDAFAHGALDAQSAVNLQTASSDRQRESITLRTQLETAEISLATLIGLGLPAASTPQLDPHS